MPGGDVYALGCLLFQTLVRATCPFTPATPTWRAVRARPRPAPRARRPRRGLPRRSTRSSGAPSPRPPTERYASAGELAGAVRAAAVTDAGRTVRSRRRRPRTAVAAGVVGLVLVAGVGVALALRDDDATRHRGGADDGRADGGRGGSGTDVETAAAASPPTSVVAPPVAASNTVAEFGADGDAPARVVGWATARPSSPSRRRPLGRQRRRPDREPVDIATGDVRTIGTAEVPTGLAVADDASGSATASPTHVTRLDREPARSAPDPRLRRARGVLVTDDAVWVAAASAATSRASTRTATRSPPECHRREPSPSLRGTIRSGSPRAPASPWSASIPRPGGATRIGLRFGADGVAASPTACGSCTRRATRCPSSTPPVTPWPYGRGGRPAARRGGDRRRRLGGAERGAAHPHRPGVRGTWGRRSPCADTRSPWPAETGYG